MRDIISLINSSSLTKSEKIIGDFILDNEMDACFMTSTDISRRLDVSEATIIRFARKLGFSGFADFQKKLRVAHQDEHRRISQSITIPHERLYKSMEYESADYLNLLALSSQDNISGAVAKNSMELFEQAVDVIVKSTNKYILASRANTGLGAYMYFLLKCMLPGVISAHTPGASDVDNISDISENDCMIVFSFPRYSGSDMLLADIALKAGAKVIAITDKNSAPLSSVADITFTADVDSHNFFNSFVGVQFILEALCSGISRRIGYSNEEKLKRIDEYLDITRLY